MENCLLAGGKGELNGTTIENAAPDEVSEPKTRSIKPMTENLGFSPTPQMHEGPVVVGLPWEQ